MAATFVVLDDALACRLWCVDECGVCSPLLDECVGYDVERGDLTWPGVDACDDDGGEAID